MLNLCLWYVWFSQEVQTHVAKCDKNYKVSLFNKQHFQLLKLVKNGNYLISDEAGSQVAITRFLFLRPSNPDTLFPFAKLEYKFDQDLFLSKNYWKRDRNHNFCAKDCFFFFKDTTNIFFRANFS